MTDVLDLFVELAAIPSPPGEERAVADRVAGYLRDLGLAVDEDDAADRVGATMGNLYARLEPTAEGHAALPLRAPRHGAARGADRARWSTDGVVRNARAARSSAPTTRPPSPRCSRPRGSCWPRAARTRASSSCSRRRRRSG